MKTHNHGKIRSVSYISDLLNCKVVDETGRHLGHVADVQLTPGPEYRVCALFFGRGGWMHRLHLLNPFEDHPHKPSRPDRVPWEAIERIEPPIITLKSGYPQRS